MVPRAIFPNKPDVQVSGYISRNVYGGKPGVDIGSILHAARSDTLPYQPERIWRAVELVLCLSRKALASVVFPLFSPALTGAIALRLIPRSQPRGVYSPVSRRRRLSERRLDWNASGGNYLWSGAQVFVCPGVSRSRLRTIQSVFVLDCAASFSYFINMGDFGSSMVRLRLDLISGFILLQIYQLSALRTTSMAAFGELDEDSDDSDPDG